MTLTVRAMYCVLCHYSVHWGQGDRAGVRTGVLCGATTTRSTGMRARRNLHTLLLVQELVAHGRPKRRRIIRDPRGDIGGRVHGCWRRLRRLFTDGAGRGRWGGGVSQGSTHVTGLWLRSTFWEHERTWHKTARALRCRCFPTRSGPVTPQPLWDAVRAATWALSSAAQGPQAAASKIQSCLPRF